MPIQQATSLEQVAAMVLTGFCANPSIFQPNPTRGWGLVNCSREELCDEALRLAEAMILRSNAVRTAEPESRRGSGE